jgi:hypothetical protein
LLRAAWVRPASWLTSSGACTLRRASARMSGWGPGAEHRTGDDLRVVVRSGCCTLSHCARGPSWVLGVVWQRLRGLAAAVILCSGAQGHGRQVSAARAVEVSRTMWKASRSVPDDSGVTTKRVS